MEWLKNIIDELNDYAGLLSLLAVLAAILVPWRIYRKNRKEDLQRLKDEFEQREHMKGVATTPDAKESSVRQHVVKMAIKRGTK